MFQPDRVRASLAQLRAADPRLRLFGASGHRYQLNPPIKERELIMWERDAEVTLPADYRTFLLELGNGGVGPYYGIFPLGRWDGAGDTLESFADATGDLRAPFPHAAAWNLPAERLTPPKDFASDVDEDAWNEACDAAYYDPSLTDGAFWISHQGCALRSMLVVTGPERGKIWDDLRPDRGGLAPRGKSFAEWYVEWLEHSLLSLTSSS